ncbi:hypothetical protein DICA4_A03972 [Diutina catenulata]
MNPSFRTSSASSPTQRKPSIVEMLSSPPPLEEELHLPLSRNPSVSSRSSATDWSDIQLSELNESNKLISIPAEMSVQEAFETLQKHNLTSLPVGIDLPNCFTFDYSDLNTYLLMVMGKIERRKRKEREKQERWRWGSHATGFGPLGAAARRSPRQEG